MGSDALDVDALIERTELPAHQVLQELTFLSIKGMVRRVDGQSFVRSRAGGAA
jgi:predicted Rossmann fold nucleotide-binding protein DprA/Smf involved in DNA uptake